MEQLPKSADVNAHLVDLSDVEAILGVLELVDIEQLNPAHHNRVIRICLKKLQRLMRA